MEGNRHDMPVSNPEDSPTTNIDKLHFIIRHAIARPDLR